MRFIKFFKRRWIMALIILGLTGFFIARSFISSKEKIKTTKVEKGTVSEELVLSGEINAQEYAKLSFATSGKISWVGVKEGDKVTKGQGLAKLDTTNLNADYQRALSDLKDAEAALLRVYDDVKGHDKDETFTQKETRTDAEATKNKAWEAVIKARKDLDNATLISPFAGIVTFVAHPYSGVNVLSTETQFEVINPQTIYFEVTADQSEVISLKKDMEVEIVIDSFSEEIFKGEVDFVALTPKQGEVGSAYKVNIKIKDGDEDKFKVGMTGDAKVILSRKENALYVPPAFVNSDSNGKFVRKGRKNNKVYIETGLESEDRVEIMGDIKEGDILYD